MDESTPLTRVSRRTVVQGAAVAAAAGTATLALGGTAQAAARPAALAGAQHEAEIPEQAGAAGAPGEGLVVHVRDLHTGELDVYNGERHSTVRDVKLARLLAALAR